MRAKVIATFELGGFHHWPAAAQVEPLVAYLASPHRHLFRFVVECSVDNPDRQVEFHLLRNAARLAVFKSTPDRLNTELDFRAASCEQIATTLGAAMRENLWPVVAVEVWEDRENGARVDW